MRVSVLTLGGLRLSATTGRAQGQTPIPAGLKNAKPHGVVERALRP